MTRTIAATSLLAALVGVASAQPRAVPDVVDAGGKGVGLLATLSPKGDYEEKYACFFVGPNGVLVGSLPGDR
jgi:hypothetical protein